MSKCSSFFSAAGRGQFLQHPIPGMKEHVSPCTVSEDEACCDCCADSVCTATVNTCAPADCPASVLTLLPAIYDECGINLCRAITLTGDLPAETARILVQVLDIDFNFGTCGTTITQQTSRPCCARVAFSNLTVTFQLTALDCCGTILFQTTETATYLTPDDTDPSSDPETNPTSVVLDLYVPNGLTYALDGETYTPSLTFLGPVASLNTFMQQGISVQAVAKVLRFDAELNLIAMGLTLYLRSIYFTEYRMPNEGLAIPPKAVPVENNQDACLDFVDGHLLAPQVCPTC